MCVMRLANQGREDESPPETPATAAAVEAATAAALAESLEQKEKHISRCSSETCAVRDERRGSETQQQERQASGVAQASDDDCRRQPFCPCYSRLLKELLLQPRLHCDCIDWGNSFRFPFSR